ncbi:PQQ-binding-like beta-propeller repeat protein [Kitasatospora sp. RB6PN24]|uniref:outer membrane protein assembly factor BamB family protein n=1 Tax=Kitasatospora humi TaxID=2893891 RepID=UPI001E3C3972|nr:PQQ-binding-like beta-propeller repeat protein [Kitasatospora humi]MCC9306376.1 PQQ-binding-like beta-propeller repeat protein [Kitasatospora humi]
MAGDQPDQKTQLDGASVPAPSQPAGAGAEDVSYQPTELAFPAQPPAGAAPAAPGTPPPPSGAPAGPYAPQAGGYGYPQGQPYPTPTPQADGYGYPQAQSYPTPAPGPQSGYPGYAQPQPGFQQAAAPGYAYPGAPGVPAPTKQRNPVMLFGAIAGSVLAIGIVIGLIVLFSTPQHPPATTGSPTGGPSGSVASGQLTDLWTAPKSGDSGDNRMIGSWVTDKLVIRGDAGALTAYNLSDGKVAWTLPAPSGTKAFCSMSKTTNKAGLGAVSFNLGDDDCAAIGAVDATSGTLKFKVGSPLPDQKSFDTAVTITDNAIGAASSGVLGGFSLADGHQLWKYSPRGQYCNGTADAAGGLIVLSDYCADGSPKQLLQVMNADTGKVGTSIPLPNENDRLSQIVQTKGMLVVQISADADGDYMFAIDSNGNQLPKIPLKVTGEDKMRPSAASAAVSHNLVLGNTLYIEVDKSNKTAIRAIDLTSGKTLWTTDGGAQQGLRLVDEGGDSPTVIAINGYDQGAQVGSLSATDGSFKASATFAQKDSLSMTFQDSEVMHSDDGRVLVLDGLPIEHSAVMYGSKN